MIVRKSLLLFGIALLLATPVSASFGKVQAITANDWKAGRIIDDNIFTNANDMSVADIQAFLNSKVPVCDSNGQKSVGYYYNASTGQPKFSWFSGGAWVTTTRAVFAQRYSAYYQTNISNLPLTCLKNYYEVPKTAPGPGLPASNAFGAPIPTGAVSAAQMIYNASIKYRINPKVLLVKLHTESAGPLTTDDWPFQNQYLYAMGAQCPDSGPGGSANCNSNYAGFSIQIDEAAALLRWYLDSMTQSWWQYKKPYQVNSILWNVSQTGCGAGDVYIETKATAALYTYTPYQPNAAALANLYGTGDGCSAYGNRNFWRIYTDWFGKTAGSPVVRTPNDPTYYYLTNGKRFAIASGDILYAYGLQSTPVEVVSDSYLSSIPSGGLLDTIFTRPGDGTVFLADGGKHYAIASGSICVAWGLACGNPAVQHELGDETFNSMSNGGLLQPVMAFKGSYYLMSNGKKQKFLSGQSLSERGYASTITPIINWTNATRPYDISLPANNSFVKIDRLGVIYYYANGTFYGFPNYQTFLAWFSEADTCYLDDVSSYNTSPPTAGTLTQYIKLGNGTIQYLDKSRRYTITSPNSLQPGDITDLSGNTSLEQRVTAKLSGTIDNATALALPGGTIAAFSAGTLRPIPTLTDLYLSYKDSDIISVGSAITNAYPVGTLSLLSGRVVKPTPSAMYIYGADASLWALGSTQELYAANRWTAGVIETSFSNLATNSIKIYKGLIKLNGIVYIVHSNGSAYYFAQSALNSDANATPISGPVAKKIPIDAAAASFIRFDNGTIFNIATDGIHPIGTLAAFNRLGGTASNTVSMPLKSLDEFKIGSVIY